MADKSYQRKISSEEAWEGYILVLKGRLGFLPPVGEGFVLAGRRVRIEAVPCTCRGPEKPHEHYRIPWPGLAQGSTVRITTGQRAATSWASSWASAEEPFALIATCERGGGWRGNRRAVTPAPPPPVIPRRGSLAPRNLYRTDVGDLTMEILRPA